LRDYYDIVFDAKCVESGKKLGFKRVLCSEINYCERSIKLVKGKFNVAKGGSLETNREAVRKPVHVLLDPVDVTRRFFDTAVAQIAKDNGVAIGISLASLLAVRGPNRARLLRNVIYMLKICRKLRNDVIIVSGASDPLGMRYPQDLASIGSLLGLDRPQSEWAVSQAPAAVIERAGV
jgi:RNase P/RNase MRP subunit p30